MPPLWKPHRVAFLLPELTLEGLEIAHPQEAALVLWMACIETCQRHPNLAVYDPESTPIAPRDAHFAPEHAIVGASPTDAVFGTARRDELVYLELGLVAGRSGVVRLHALARDGTTQSFDAVGRRLGDQIDQVFAAWLNARELGALPKRFEAITAEDVVAVARVIGPPLVEGARAPSTGAASSWSVAGAESDDLDAVTIVPTKSKSRTVAQRLPAALKVSALRVLALALDEPLDDLILAIDPEHPQALLATMGDRDYTRLRRAIAAAPGWAHAYAELAHGAGSNAPDAPKPLEVAAAAGLAVMGRPGNFSVLASASDALAATGNLDEAIRLMTRAVALHDQPSAHLALMHAVRAADRVGEYLAIAMRAGQLHGCPMESAWYPDQIHVDLRASDALLHVGRLDEAIALRGNRLDGREAAWPRYTRILDGWKRDPKFVAWSYAREGYFRGDEARAVEGFGRIEPGDATDVQIFLDSLVALGREAEVPLAWAHVGRGRGHDGAVARLAAARGLMAAGSWRQGLEELWRVELADPGRDAQVAIARGGLLLSIAPIADAELALGDRVAVGATTLARRLARDIADFMPAAAKSGLVTRALGTAGKGTEFDPAWLAGFARDTRSRQALDALFVDYGSDPGTRGDRLIDRWLEVAFTEASEDDPEALVQAAAYAAAQALARYLAATTTTPSPIAGALRTVASEALELVRRHRDALGDREARALLATLEPVLRRVDRWVGSSWLATVERCCGIDERAGGDVAGFAKDLPTVGARILGPEEEAVLAASVARLHRERPEGWASAVGTQAERLALHTGFVGVDEWADAVVAQLDGRAIEIDDAIDALHTACFLAEGRSAAPCLHAARVLLRGGRAPAALGLLVRGLAAATIAERDAGLASLADDWRRSSIDVPLAFDKLALGVFEALQKGDAARAEKLGALTVAIDPTNAEAHRNLGLALAQQGKVAEALHHLVRATPDQATQILSGVLYQAGKLPDAMAVLDYASRWYVRADQWLTYGGIAYAAMDNPRTAKAYRIAYQLDPAAFDQTQLNAYAGVLDEVGDYATCETIAKQLLDTAGDDLMWRTCAWNHQACALIGLGKFTRATELAERAVAENPLPDNTAPFAATLTRAKAKTVPTVPAAEAEPMAEPAFAALARGEHAAVAGLLADPSWRARRAALCASRFRFASENRVVVTARARSAASTIMAATVGATDRDAVIARALALQVREQAYFARDPVPTLGDRMTRGAFYQEFRARGGVVLGAEAVVVAPFVDRVVVPGAKVARASDYVALLRDLAALAPREALALFDLDADGYVEVSKAWAAAMDADPTLATTIAAGLARGRG